MSATMNRSASPVRPADDRWSGFSLTRRYALASLPVVLSLMFLIGWWVNRSIEQQVISQNALNVALYVQGFITPELQGLAERSYVTDAEMSALESLLADTPLGKEVLSIKIWKEDGVLAYYSRQAHVSQRFEPTENLQRAWRGEVTSAFDDLQQAEDALEAELGLAMFEIYSPIRQQGHGKIIAVAEFYQDAEPLSARLAETRWKTWAVVIAATIVAYSLLYGIVHNGGVVIRRQRETLSGQVATLSELLAENERLGVRLKRAARRTTELNERWLRRISADLHDGPAQYMSLALLRLDALLTAPVSGASVETKDAVTELRKILNESLTELRNISRGLALPDLEDLDLLETVQLAVKAHSRRTRTEIELRAAPDQLARSAGMSVKLTLYRTVQEALMNAFRHADGVDQCVEVDVDSHVLRVAIRDNGPGFEADDHPDAFDRLGLSGLRERIESLGGEFRVVSSLGNGTTVQAELPLHAAL